MEAGRELDALIAEKVMGCKILYVGTVSGEKPWGCGCLNEIHSIGDGDAELKEFSTDIAAAWEVVEKLREKYNSVDICALSPTLKGCHYKVKLWDNAWSDSITILSETVPRAICLAALKAIGHEV